MTALPGLAASSASCDSLPQCSGHFGEQGKTAGILRADDRLAVRPWPPGTRCPERNCHIAVARSHSSPGTAWGLGSRMALFWGQRSPNSDGTEQACPELDRLVSSPSQVGSRPPLTSGLREPPTLYTPHPLSLLPSPQA